MFTPIEVTIWIATIALCMFLNHVRGGGYGKLLPAPDMDKGFIIFAIYGLLAYALTLQWELGLIVFLGSVIQWRPGWGAWYDLGRSDDSRGGSAPWGINDPRWKDPFVKTLTFLGFGSDHVSFFIRNLFVAPMVIAAWWWFALPTAILMTIPAFAFLYVLTYEMAYWFRGERFGWSEIAESLGGAVWGMLLLILIYSI